jgi:ankyrin repeat protein
MSDVTLPPRPDLQQLGRRAKELRDAARAGDADALARVERQLGPLNARELRLAAAQLVIAREHGFASWPTLRAEVDRRRLSFGERVEAFLTASVDGRTGAAERALAEAPELARVDLRTACVAGEVERVRELLRADPAAALAPDAARGWPPLLYACHSCWHQIDPARADGLVAVAELLLEAGADPDSSNGRPSRHGYQSALYGAAGVAGNPELTRLLLERGANPDDDESLYHAACRDDPACLRLLVEHGAKAPGTNALPAAIGRGDAEAVRLLLQAGADPGRPHPDEPAPTGLLPTRELDPLPAAAALDTPEVVALLLDAGADPDARGRDGRSAIRLATRAGRPETADLLRRAGARDDTTAVDRFLGACAVADAGAARAVLAEVPGLVAGLDRDDLAALVDAADHAGPAPVALMLDLGFPIGTRRPQDGATALHAAAYRGRVDVVRLLLERGADVDALDGQWRSTAVSWATVGSGEEPSSTPPPDWIATIHALLDAGASTDGATIASKPPSEEVAALLADDLAAVAERLRTAYEEADEQELAAVLHPDVRWGGGPAGCWNRDHVLEWYRVLARQGVRARVEDVTLSDGAVVLTLAVVRPDHPQAVQHVRQRLVIEHGLVTRIEEDGTGELQVQ